MTIDQFLVALAETPNQWRYLGVALRCDGLCPIQMVYGERLNWTVAATRLGLAPADMDAIADAADAHPVHDVALRSRLLLATVER